jgi:hypothetical protein
MKSLLKVALLLISCFSLLQSCTYDKELLPAAVSACPDTLNVSFAAKIKPLLQANCISCHGNGTNAGNVSLDSYSGVRQAALSGRLLGAISHSAGYAPMPQGAGKLNSCSIIAVKTWIDEGAKNN